MEPTVTLLLDLCLMLSAVGYVLLWSSVNLSLLPALVAVLLDMTSMDMGPGHINTLSVSITSAPRMRSGSLTVTRLRVLACIL